MKNLITCLVVCVMSGVVAAEIHHVPADFPTIQYAIDAALDGDEIIVAPGTYTSTADEVVDMGGKAVTLRSSDPSDPDVVAATIIDGEGARRGLACYNEETSKTIISGFTITNGNINTGTTYGGGMSNKNSSPTLTNCTFTANTSAHRGGGMWNDGGSNPTLTNCTFKNNTSNSDGGGMWNDGGSEPTLTNCTFENNTAIRGGGMYNSGNPTLENCTFTDNIATDSGGGMVNDNNSPTLTGCTFTGNAADSGGGMFNWHSSNPTLTGCTFENNTTNDDGGGMYNHYSSPTLTNCIFTSNSAYSGGGMYNLDNSSPTLTNCTFTNNTASDRGGGMQNYYFSSPTLIDCIFTDNTAYYDGGGMHNNNNSSPTLNDCTLTNNTANNNGGMYNIDKSIPTLTDTIVCGNTPGQIYGDWVDNGGNTVTDVCPAVDKDGDGVDDSIDNCYLYNPDQADCNDNGFGDVCDIDDQTSYDCDQNGVPDECQPDCDGDGWIDACDSEGDCDDDGIPDNCELDCNENSIPDNCDIIFGFSQDCNENGVPDECDIAGGLEEDCNGNDIPDSCDIAEGTEEDCNGNDVPDSCELEVVFQEEAKLLSSDGEWYDEFGWSLAISGDTVVAGASGDDDNVNDSGSAYIYKLAGGVWQETKLLASDGASNDYFGISVATSGDTVVVGAHHDDDNGNDSGSAYIYRFDGISWIETKLLPSDGATDDLFGASVATSGDTVVVGALHDDDNGSNSGSAYIYKLAGGVWQETKLLASDGASNDYFGRKVATHGDTVVVGASGDNDSGAGSGSAYIYRFDGISWIETKLLASDGATDDLFGLSVATSGDTVVVGAHHDDDNGSRSGSAYIYKLAGGVWQETKLLASDGASNDYFGRKVATHGDTVVVGASGDDDNVNDSGSAYIYRFDGISWIETKLLASDAIYYDLFGSSVAISGDKVVVGALGEYGLGSVYIFGATMLANDCNANGVPDECDIDDGTSNDVNGNSIPDECEVDCNGNGVPDHWDIKTGTSEDCNANGVPDECDINDGTSTDWNENGIPDECEVDCNTNGYPDDYDIKMGWSEDVNGDGVPDECQCIADITGDSMVNVKDLLAIIGYWGSDGPLGDVNADGIVDVLDLLIVIGNWGPCE